MVAEGVNQSQYTLILNTPILDGIHQTCRWGM